MVLLQRSDPARVSLCIHCIAEIDARATPYVLPVPMPRAYPPLGAPRSVSSTRGGISAGSSLTGRLPPLVPKSA